MFEAPAPSGRPATSSTVAGGDNSTANADGGSFAEVGGDPLDIRPEPVEADEEGEETASNFRAIQIDPVREDSAGPKFVKTFDIDNDGLPDLLTAWNQSQPVQIHLQRRDAEGNVSFTAVSLGGTSPIALIGGVDMADFDGDGWLDVAVLIKTTGAVPICPKPGTVPPYEILSDSDYTELQILFSPGNLEAITDGDAWQEVRFDRSHLPGRRDESVAQARTFPEFNSFSGIAAGEIDGINGPDIVVMYNPAVCEFYGDDPPINRMLFFPNPGGINTRDAGTIPLTAVALAGDDQSVSIPAPDDPQPAGTPVTLDGTGSYTSEFGAPAMFWEQVAGPDAALAGAGGTAEFTAPITSAALSFRLSASAGGMTDYDYVNVIVGAPGNLPPTVTTAGDQTVIADAESADPALIVLSAFASDPDGDALTYTWEQVGGPAVDLQNADLPNASFTSPELGGEHRFRVTVTDGDYFDSALVVVIAGVWAPIWLDTSAARAGDVTLSDVDQDGDSDIVYTFPNQITSNISWARNPLVPHDELSPSGPSAVHSLWNWQVRPVGQVDTEADVLQIGDVDLDGYDDVLVRSQTGRVVQWFRHPGAADLEPIFPPPDVVPDRFNFPWQVYTVAEYDFRLPAGIAVGDVTGDGLNEVVAAAGGVIYWYDASSGGNAYDTWQENFVVDDTKAEGTTDDPDDPDFEDNGTVINWLTIVDVDGDGFGDVIGTFDRRTMSGLNEDTLIWFRNTLGDQAARGD